jgi:hypothetical protein
VITLKNRGFHGIMHELGYELLHRSKPVESLTWQSQPTQGRPGMGKTWELEDVCFEVAVPEDTALQTMLVKPNLPWADMHFDERVGGVPVNPPPSHRVWPFAQGSNGEHVDDSQKFSHTYPERFWPKHAGTGHGPTSCNWHDTTDFCDLGPQYGVRFYYGDLSDVVRMLAGDPTTRQAYLPVWFPEDTGATDGQRVPCTLGYQFRIRGGRLNCTYNMRSCDYLRHMRDDVYMAMRLMKWVSDQLSEQAYEGREDLLSIGLGTLAMNIGSLHIFDGDMPTMTSLVAELAFTSSQRMMEVMSG